MDAISPKKFLVADAKKTIYVLLMVVVVAHELA
jgi:hypothetical protein